MPIYMEITDGTAKGKKLKASFYKTENGKRNYLKVVQFKR